jgi:type II secretory pathway pseudopilin PulG
MDALRERFSPDALRPRGTPGGSRRDTRRTATGFTTIEVLVVLGVFLVLGAFTVPIVGRTLAGIRVSGDARSLSNAVSVAKIRAAAKFTKVRLFVNLAARTYHVETLDRDVVPHHWTQEGGTSSLSYGVDFDFGPVDEPPPNSQAVIGQAPLCKTDDGDDIAGTACIVFNSRGVSVDSTGAPHAEGVLYIMDDTVVYGITVAATGMLRLWRATPAAGATWVLQ